LPLKAIPVNNTKFTFENRKAKAADCTSGPARFPHISPGEEGDFVTWLQFPSGEVRNVRRTAGLCFSSWMRGYGNIAT